MNEAQGPPDQPDDNHKSTEEAQTCDHDWEIISYGFQYVDGHGHEWYEIERECQRCLMIEAFDIK